MARYFAHLDGPGMARERGDFAKIADAKQWAQDFPGPAEWLHVWQGNWRCAALFRKVGDDWRRITA